jgi:hypothetical protein
VLSNALWPPVYATASSAVSPGSLTLPDVDGYNDHWMVAWQSRASAFSDPAVKVLPATYGANGSMNFGTVTTFGGTTLEAADTPTVGYSLGRTWIGYHAEGISVGANALRARAIDTQSGVNGGDLFTESMSTTDTRMVVATQTSGGTPGEGALAVFGEADNIFAQRLINYGTTGATTNLGGGCGNGGTQSFSHSPGIGSSAFACTINGLPPTALATVFNFAPGGGVPLVCGACVWLPFSVTQTRPIAAGSASIQFPIPCLPSLVGSAFETQWTSIDFSQAPCSLAPGFVLSNRLLMTLGQ